MATQAPLLPVNVQRDEDAALGAAWRRCMKALPTGWELALASTDRPDTISAGAYDHTNTIRESAHRTTAVDALTALAEVLEA